jgi:hypothetical protein
VPLKEMPPGGSVLFAALLVAFCLARLVDGVHFSNETAMDESSRPSDSAREALQCPEWTDDEALLILMTKRAKEFPKNGNTKLIEEMINFVERKPEPEWAGIYRLTLEDTLRVCISNHWLIKPIVALERVFERIQKGQWERIHAKIKLDAIQIGLQDNSSRIFYRILALSNSSIGQFVDGKSLLKIFQNFSKASPSRQHPERAFEISKILLITCIEFVTEMHEEHFLHLIAIALNHKMKIFQILFSSIELTESVWLKLSASALYRLFHLCTRLRLSGTNSAAVFELLEHLDAENLHAIASDLLSMAYPLVCNQGSVLDLFWSIVDSPEANREAAFKLAYLLVSGLFHWKYAGLQIVSQDELHRLFKFYLEHVHQKQNFEKYTVDFSPFEDCAKEKKTFEIANKRDRNTDRAARYLISLAHRTNARISIEFCLTGECTICMEEFKPGSKYFFFHPPLDLTPSCSSKAHLVHWNCAYRWYLARKSDSLPFRCPVCSLEYVPDRDTINYRHMVNSWKPTFEEISGCLQIENRLSSDEIRSAFRDAGNDYFDSGMHHLPGQGRCFYILGVVILFHLLMWCILARYT